LSLSFTDRRNVGIVQLAHHWFTAQFIVMIQLT
jgi:hypothetical protein